MPCDNDIKIARFLLEWKKSDDTELLTQESINNGFYSFLMVEKDLNKLFLALILIPSLKDE